MNDNTALLLEIVAIYAAVSLLVDAENTTNNIAGDVTGTAIVHSKFGEMMEDM